MSESKMSDLELLIEKMVKELLPKLNQEDMAALVGDLGKPSSDETIIMENFNEKFPIMLSIKIVSIIISSYIRKHGADMIMRDYVKLNKVADELSKAFWYFTEYATKEDDGIGLRDIDDNYVIVKLPDTDKDKKSFSLIDVLESFFSMNAKEPKH